MSNRIDLTQFEGIWDKKHLLLIEKTPTDGYHWSIGFENDVEASMSVSSEFGKEIHEEADRFYHAIDKLPGLIAELKRTYDKIDVLEERLQFSEHIMETMHDEHYADLVMDFIEQAHPSKWCDWGHCREGQRLKNE